MTSTSAPQPTSPASPHQSGADPAAAPRAGRVGEVAVDGEFIRLVGVRAVLLRQARGLSKRGLARRADGVSDYIVAAVESGEHAPGLLALRRLADALGVPLGVLLDGPTDPATLDALAAAARGAGETRPGAAGEEVFLRLLGRRVRLLRRMRGFSNLRQLAAVTGLMWQTLGAIEDARTRPRASAACRIAAAVGVPVRTLVDGALEAGVLAPVFWFPSGGTGLAAGTLSTVGTVGSTSWAAGVRAAAADQQLDWRLLLGRRLIALRELRGLRAKDLARRAGVDLTSLSDIECGQRRPRDLTVRRLAAGLRVPPVSLTHGAAPGDLFAPLLQLHPPRPPTRARPPARRAAATTAAAAQPPAGSHPQPPVPAAGQLPGRPARSHKSPRRLAAQA